MSELVPADDRGLRRTSSDGLIGFEAGAELGLSVLRAPARRTVVLPTRSGGTFFAVSKGIVPESLLKDARELVPATSSTGSEFEAVIGEHEVLAWRLWGESEPCRGFLEALPRNDIAWIELVRRVPDPADAGTALARLPSLRGVNIAPARPEFVEGLASSATLEHLELLRSNAPRSEEISPDEIGRLFSAVSRIETLARLTVHLISSGGTWDGATVTPPARGIGRRLQSLTVFGRGFGPQLVDCLANCGELRELNLVSSLREEGLAAALCRVAAHLPALEELSWFTTPATLVDTEALSRSQRLVKLAIPLHDPNAVPPLAELRDLQSLHIRDNFHFGVHDLQELAGLARLRVLRVDLFRRLPFPDWWSNLDRVEIRDPLELPASEAQRLRSSHPNVAFSTLEEFRERSTRRSRLGTS